MAASDRFIELGQHGGPIIPADCWHLYIELGSRNFTMTTEDAGKVLVVRPPEKLTTADVARLKQWRWHLLLMLDYFARPHFDAHLYRETPAPSVPDGRTAA